MVIMYCPKCGMNVETKKEDFRIGLAILLAIFTGGLGLLIYVAIYLDKPQNRCVHCNSVCKVQVREIYNQTYSNYQIPAYSNQNQKQQQILVQQVSDGTAKFCYNCGTPIREEEAQFCAYCGSNIE